MEGGDSGAEELGADAPRSPSGLGYVEELVEVMAG